MGLAHEGILPARQRVDGTKAAKAASAGAGRLLRMDPLAALATLPGVAPALREERDAVDRLLAHRWLRRNASDVSVAAGERAATGAAGLEQCPLGVALALQAASGGLAHTWESAPRQALARMHVLATADLGLAAESLGRPRADTEVTSRLELLMAAVSQSQAPAVVVSGIVHGELLALRAFGQRSGLVARAAARAVLVSSGHDPRAILPFEVGYDPLVYPRQIAGYESGDVAGWLVAWCRALISAAAQTFALCEELRSRAG